MFKNTKIFIIMLFNNVLRFFFNPLIGLNRVCAGSPAYEVVASFSRTKDKKMVSVVCVLCMPAL